MLDLYKNIKNRRLALDMTQTDLAKKLGYSDKSMIAKIEKGLVDLSQSKISAFAKALNTTEIELMGWTAVTQPAASDDIDALIDKYPELHRVEKRSFPMRGDIACGSPIVANEEHDSFIEADADIDADFCLRAKGDSMINARIHDGDIVFIKKCTAVDDGDIAAVIIDEDTTLKRVKYDKKNNILVLIAENPAYEPLVFVGEQLNHVHIIGKAVFFQAFL